PFTLSLRDGQWQYIAPQMVTPPGWLKNKHDPLGIADSVQLYNLNKDIKENDNVAAKHPELVKKLQQKLQQLHKTPARQRIMLEEKGGQ
ncbi:MAG TPA: hypothetical protein VKA34_06505, partial [Balneolales bacterium]|nr:hypothetical protein [Balneolales bacterium]